MTTQPTHHDESGVDATTVVEHGYASETANITAAENTTATSPAEAHTDVDEQAQQQESTPVETVEEPAQLTSSTSPIELSQFTHVPAQIAGQEASEDVQADAQTEIATSESAAVSTEQESSAPTTEAPTASITTAPDVTAQTAPAPAAAVDATPTEAEATESAATTEPASTAATSSDSSFSFAEVHLPEKPEEEVLPFAAFFEEFQQKEERFNATVRESQMETFALLTPAEGNLAASQPGFLMDAPAITAVGTTKGDEVIIVPKDESEQTLKEVEEIKTTEEIKEITPPPTPAPMKDERPVSPLLRPATRLRSRHAARQHREEMAAAAAAAEAAAATQRATQLQTPELPPSLASAVAAQQAEPQHLLEQPGTVETPAEAETPRPARRYRFDRPSKAAAAAVAPTPVVATTSSLPPSLQRAEENARNQPSPLVVPAAQAPQPSATPVSEVAAKSTAEPAAPTTPVETNRPTSPLLDQSRRRSHERQKELPAQPAQPTPVASVPPVSAASSITPEPAVQPEEIAPEDLPPLEYSELQKGAVRRRRRHRTANGTGTVADIANGQLPTLSTSPVVQPRPAAPTAPAAPATPPITPAAPATPFSPSTANAPYSIVSGYTVSQMNQGNDLTGPFMGPEPSPAKGSVLSRDGGRTTPRAELQTPRSTLHPARTHEGNLSSASMNHFANIVSQAIQSQTDRMIAELRRANQAPTSVSVSLPPFPSTERVGVFVDVANLLYSARTMRLTVDFGKLLDFLRGNRRLVRAHAYCPTSPQQGEEQMFLQAVKGLGYRITTKNYKTFSSGAKKADLDLDLCMDVVRLVDGKAVDCIILVSGDSDFMPMLDYCSDHGVRVEVAAFDEAISATLRQSCDLFINLSMLEEIRS